MIHALVNLESLLNSVDDKLRIVIVDWGAFQKRTITECNIDDRGDLRIP